MRRRRSTRCSAARRLAPALRRTTRDTSSRTCSARAIRMTAESAELAAVAARFAIDGALTSAAPLGRGHIHDSYLLAFDAGTRVRRYVLQRLNMHVFADPRTLTHNVARVTAHLRGRLEARGERDIERRCLTLVGTPSGDPAISDARGAWWRAWRYVEGSVTHESIEKEAQARSAARAY